MIEINLIPEEMRNRVVSPAKKPVSIAQVRPGPQLLLLFIPAAFILLIMAHIFFVLIGFTRAAKLNSLRAKWEKALWQRNALEAFNAEHSFASADSVEIGRLLSERVDWSERLNRLSLSLPAGVWLDFISVSAKEFYLRGKAVSLDGAEVSLIRNYVDQIKSRPDFMKRFGSLEITSIQKTAIGTYEVAVFSLTGEFK